MQFPTSSGPGGMNDRPGIGFAPRVPTNCIIFLMGGFPDNRFKVWIRYPDNASVAETHDWDVSFPRTWMQRSWSLEIVRSTFSVDITISIAIPMRSASSWDACTDGSMSFNSQRWNFKKGANLHVPQDRFDHRFPFGINDGIRIEKVCESRLNGQWDILVCVANCCEELACSYGYTD